jgi:hypothetical protein
VKKDIPYAGTGTKGCRKAGAADQEWPVASSPQFDLKGIARAQRRMPEWVAAVFADVSIDFDHQQLDASGHSPPNNASGALLGPSVQPATAGSRSSFVHVPMLLTPQQQVSNGLSDWALLLYPTEEERQKMGAAVQAVKQEAEWVCTTETYQVVQVTAVGSHAKNTSLRNT